MLVAYFTWLGEALQLATPSPCLEPTLPGLARHFSSLHHRHAWSLLYLAWRGTSARHTITMLGAYFTWLARHFSSLHHHHAWSLLYLAWRGTSARHTITMLGAYFTWLGEALQLATPSPCLEPTLPDLVRHFSSPHHHHAWSLLYLAWRGTSAHYTITMLGAYFTRLGEALQLATPSPCLEPTLPGLARHFSSLHHRHAWSLLYQAWRGTSAHYTITMLGAYFTWLGEALQLATPSPCLEPTLPGLARHFSSLHHHHAWSLLYQAWRGTSARYTIAMLGAYFTRLGEALQLATPSPCMEPTLPSLARHFSSLHRHHAWSLLYLAWRGTSARYTIAMLGAYFTWLGEALQLATPSPCLEPTLPGLARHFSSLHHHHAWSLLYQAWRGTSARYTIAMLGAYFTRLGEALQLATPSTFSQVLHLLIIIILCVPRLASSVKLPSALIVWTLRTARSGRGYSIAIHCRIGNVSVIN